MIQRGRKSAQQLATVETGSVTVVNRPDALLDLTPEETDVWDRTVSSLPADWFQPGTWPLLAQYCRHTVTARRVAQLIDAAMARDEVNVGELRELLAMQAKETSSLKAMAASMRISQQAGYTDPRVAGMAKARRTAMSRPWE